MYTPERFVSQDKMLIQEIIQKNSFAPIMSVDEQQNIQTSFIPLVPHFENGQLIRVSGHYAKNNPQWRLFQKNPTCTVLFQGPHTYITPTWYKSGRDVPTWNYCVVQVRGRIKLIEDFKGICLQLKELTEFYEGPQGWRMELPADLRSPESLTNTILAFEIENLEVHAKFKLSQNRPAIDQEGVIDGLSTTRTDENSLSIRDLMKRNLQK